MHINDLLNMDRASAKAVIDELDENRLRKCENLLYEKGIGHPNMSMIAYLIGEAKERLPKLKVRIDEYRARTEQYRHIDESGF